MRFPTVYRRRRPTPVPDLLILTLRYGGAVALALCLLWAAAAILMFNVDMRAARLSFQRQKRLIGDLFWHLTCVILAGGAACFAILTSFI